MWQLHDLGTRNKFKEETAAVYSTYNPMAQTFLTEHPSSQL